MTTSRTTKDILVVPAGTEQAELTLQELAAVFGGSGLVGWIDPTLRRYNNAVLSNNTSSSDNNPTPYASEPYQPPVDVPASEPVIPRDSAAVGPWY